MKLSLVFELLLIFVLLAFAASRVIDSKTSHHGRKAIKQKTSLKSKNRQEQQDVNKYCSCTSKICNCCREFNIPVVKLQGPGCASLQYLQGDRLAISMSFGERVLTNTTVSGKNPKPVCMPLPGGVSKFCGRVYNIARKGEEFKACLGLELRALKDVEASLRVSCFRFGPNGLKTEPAQPLPIVPAAPAAVLGNAEDEDEEEEEDDDEYSYDFDEEYEVDNDVDSADYSSFSVFDDDFVGNLFGGGGTEYVVEVPAKPTKAPARKNTRKPTHSTPKPVKKVTVKPNKVKTTNKKKESSTLSTAKITVATTSKPETPIVPNSNVRPEVEASSESAPSPPHESIAAVTAMLQNFPAEVSQVTQINNKPTKANDAANNTGSTQSPLKLTSNTESQTKQPSPETTEAAPDDKVNTEAYVGTTEEDDEDDSTETVENYIIKDDTKDEEDDDEDDDDDDDDIIDDETLTAPISSVVEKVLGEETKADQNTTATDKKNKTKKPESVIDSIVEGVVETFTGEETKKGNKKKVQDDDSAESDESADDSEENDDDDDEDEDEDDARNINLQFKPASIRSRQSKDMRLS